MSHDASFPFQVVSEYEPAGDQPGAVQYLVADPSIVCYEGEHIAILMGAVIGMVVYVVLVPYMYWCAALVVSTHDRRKLVACHRS